MTITNVPPRYWISVRRRKLMWSLGPEQIWAGVTIRGYWLRYRAEIRVRTHVPLC